MVDYKKMIYAILDHFMQEEGTIYLENGEDIDRLQDSYELTNQEKKILYSIVKRLNEEHCVEFGI